MLFLWNVHVIMLSWSKSPMCKSPIWNCRLHVSIKWLQKKKKTAKSFPTFVFPVEFSVELHHIMLTFELNEHQHFDWGKLNMCVRVCVRACNAALEVGNVAAQAGCSGTWLSIVAWQPHTISRVLSPSSSSSSPSRPPFTLLSALSLPSQQTLLHSSHRLICSPNSSETPFRHYRFASRVHRDEDSEDENGRFWRGVSECRDTIGRKKWRRAPSADIHYIFFLINKETCRYILNNRCQTHPSNTFHFHYKALTMQLLKSGRTEKCDPDYHFTPRHGIVAFIEGRFCIFFTEFKIGPMFF